MATCRARRKRAGPSGIRWSNTTNGPKVAFRCLSKIWPNAGTSEYLRLLAAQAAVTMPGAQIISRKDRIEGCGILRDLTPDDLICRGQTEDKVRTAWRH